MENKFEDFAYREADLRQLVSIAATHPSRERFLTEFTLDPPNATSAEPDAPILDEDYLTLSTIHSAKGQEWSSVFMLNTVDGCIPADLAVGESDEIEEERRLLYVAMTRAKEQLHLMIPQRFYTYNQRNLGDNHVYGQRTRFIPRSLVKHFEEIAWPPNHTGSPVHRNPFRKPADVKARMRSMWA